MIGSLDDFLVLFVGAKLLQKITPADVLTECRERADAAETRRKEEITWGTSLAAYFLFATVWIFAAITASALITTYITKGKPLH